MLMEESDLVILILALFVLIIITQFSTLRFISKTIDTFMDYWAEMYLKIQMIENELISTTDEEKRR